MSRSFVRSLDSQITRRPHRSVLIAAMLCLAAGAFVGALLTWPRAGALGPSSSSMRLTSSQYPLIRPLLMCNVDPKDFNEDKDLEKVVMQFVAARKTSGEVSNMSVYIINYKTGQWTGVNENDRYDPASMLKVPLMIAYLKAAEKDPAVLSQQISFNGDDQNGDEFFKSAQDMVPGKFYTLDQAIASMIVHSDNNAAVLLDKSIDKNAQGDVYTDLGLSVPQEGANVDYLSAKQYGYFFRILYNATYLDEANSEKALDLLSQTEFQGLNAGVPSGVKVAHKFGERTIYDQLGNVQDRELHDCGIVYKPDAPYLLCIMSRGNDFTQLQKNIQDLSALVYKNI